MKDILDACLWLAERPVIYARTRYYASDDHMCMFFQNYFHPAIVGVSLRHTQHTPATILTIYTRVRPRRFEIYAKEMVYPIVNPGTKGNKRLLDKIWTSFSECQRKRYIAWIEELYESHK